MFRIGFAVLLICGIVSSGYAQDSTKKAGAGAAKSGSVKTYPKPYHAKKDSTAIKRRIQDSLHLHAAANSAPAGVDNSLKGQYQYLLNRIYYYQQPLLLAFWKNVRDTLKASGGELKAEEKKLTAQNKLIDSLNTALSDNNSAINERINNVSLFGISLPKTTYNLLMWGLLIIAIIIVFVVIGRSASHRHEAQYRIKLYSELEDEFKSYKKQANEKEKKLARELQTERNKLDDLLGRG